MSRVVKKPEVRKEELIDIALKQFLHNGYENTSVKDIYMEANGSFGMFYHHFKSKDEIFTLAMDKLVNMFINKLSDILLNNKVPYKQRYSQAIISLIEFLDGRDKVISFKRSEMDISVFRLLSLRIISELIPIVQQFLEIGSEKGLIHIENTHQAAIIMTYGIYGIIREEGLRMASNKNALAVLSSLSPIIAKLLDSEKELFEMHIKEDEEIK